MKTFWITFGVVAVLVIAVFYIVSASLAGTFENISSTNYSLNRKEIKLTAENGADTIVNLGGNKPKIFHFWATYCKPCIQEFDSIKKYRDNLKNADLFLISLEEPNKVNAFLKDKKLDLPFYIADTAALPFTPQKIQYLPLTVIVENDSVTHTGIGIVEWDKVTF